MAAHRCTICGEEKPLDEFIKHRARLAGRRWATGTAWWCDACRKSYSRGWLAKHPGYSTDAVRKYREDPEKRERDRERARRWKDVNREANRARDRERYHRIRREQRGDLA